MKIIGAGKGQNIKLFRKVAKVKVRVS